MLFLRPRTVIGGVVEGCTRFTSGAIVVGGTTTLTVLVDARDVSDRVVDVAEEEPSDPGLLRRLRAQKSTIERWCALEGPSDRVIS